MKPDGMNPVENHLRHIASSVEIINEARNGRMFILVADTPSRNGGDLVLPAQMVTPDAINFMATHGRGLVSLALSQERSEDLDLQMMPCSKGLSQEHPHAVSIEARTGVSTGISARDRARTIAVAVDVSNGPECLVTPGHVFPLIACQGGVLVRADRIEAAVDVARLASLNPAGVICKILSDDGSVAPLDDLISLAQRLGLKIGTIQDLIAYRSRHDRLIEDVEEACFSSRWGGDWTMRTFINTATKAEEVAFVKGTIDPSRPTLVWMHALSVLPDIFGKGNDSGGQLEEAMSAIGDWGCGVVLLTERPAVATLPDIVIERIEQQKGICGDISELPDRNMPDYSMGAQILSHMGVQDVILLNESDGVHDALERHDFAIIERRLIPSVEAAYA